MSDIRSWSTTAASNNASPPNGWPEGQAPSTVNDCAREMMRAVRKQMERAQWFDFGDTVSYVSATQFKVTGDVTARYTTDQRLRLFDASTIHATVVTSAYSAPDTTVTIKVDSGTPSTSLTSVELAILSPTNISIPQNMIKTLTYAAATGGVTNSYSIALTPAPSSYVAGMQIVFKADTANTTAATVNVNSLGAKSLKKSVSQDLTTSNIVANQIVTAIYDGTNFQTNLISTPVTSLPPKEIFFGAAAFESNQSAPASLEFLNGTAVDTLVRAFDDTTVEYVDGKFMVPANIDTAGTVTFRLIGMAKTAAASRFVEFTFEHYAVADGEDFDPASPFTAEVSGDLTVDSTQDNIQVDTWTETVSNLGWSASDMVIFKLSRTQPTGTELTGDYYVFAFVIIVPRV